MKINLLDENEKAKFYQIGFYEVIVSKQDKNDIVVRKTNNDKWLPQIVIHYDWSTKKSSVEVVAVGWGYLNLQELREYMLAMECAQETADAININFIMDFK